MFFWYLKYSIKDRNMTIKCEPTKGNLMLIALIVLRLIEVSDIVRKLLEKIMNSRWILTHKFGIGSVKPKERMPVIMFTIYLSIRDATQNFTKYLNILFTLVPPIPPPPPPSALGATEIAVVHCMTSVTIFLK